MVGLGTGDGIEHHLDLYLDEERAVVIIAGAIGSCPLSRAVWGWCESVSSPAVRVALDVGLVAMVMSILLASASMLAAGTHNPFIYFRF
jgi:alginate O-acetyltransferase complex protein AlgI